MIVAVFALTNLIQLNTHAHTHTHFATELSLYKSIRTVCNNIPRLLEYSIAVNDVDNYTEKWNYEILMSLSCMVRYCQSLIRPKVTENNTVLELLNNPDLTLHSTFFK